MAKKGFTVPTLPHYYLEYCEGGDLSNFKEFDITDVYSQVFAGLKHLYENYVIHSDIKEDNVLVTIKDSKPIYKIADFGLSVDIKALPPNTDGSVNQLSLFINATPQYRPSYLKYSTYFRDLYALFCMLIYLHTQINFNFNKDNTSKQISPSDKKAITGLPSILKFHDKLLKLQTALFRTYNDPISKTKITKIIPGADGYEDTIVRNPLDEGEILYINATEDHKQYDEIYN